jgi:hypothetical protein
LAAFFLAKVALNFFRHSELPLRCLIGMPTRLTFSKERRALFGYNKKTQIGHDPSCRSLLERICWSERYTCMRSPLSASG